MKRILNWLLLLGFVGMATAQEPIIRVKQIGTWSTPAMWWKGSVTQDLDDFLAQDVSKPAEDNNNFDIWRDNGYTTPRVKKINFFLNPFI